MAGTWAKSPSFDLNVLSCGLHFLPVNVCIGVLTEAYISRIASRLLPYPSTAKQSTVEECSFEIHSSGEAEIFVHVSGTTLLAAGLWSAFNRPIPRVVR